MDVAPNEPESWHVIVDDADCVSTGGRRALSDLRDDQFIDCNSEANARLIAASPDMLEALEMFIRWEATGTPVSDICFARARNAISKARHGNV